MTSHTVSQALTTIGARTPAARAATRAVPGFHRAVHLARYARDLPEYAGLRARIGKPRCVGAGPYSNKRVGIDQAVSRKSPGEPLPNRSIATSAR